MIIGFIIWSICAIIFLGIGISCRKSQEAVGFFTFTKPPIVKNVKHYNHAVSVLWLVAAAIFEMIGIPIILMEQNSPYFLFVDLGALVWVIAIMIAYLKIEAKYKK